MPNRTRFYACVSTALFAALLLASCNPVKKVLRDPAKTEVVGREWEKKNPCVNTVSQIIQGKEILLHDTLTSDSLIQALNVQIDSLISTRCTEIVSGDRSKLKRDIEAKLRKECKPEHYYRVDTFFKIDNRRLNILNDSLNFYRGIKQELKTQLKEQKKKTTKWRIFCLVLAAVIIIHCYLKIRYPKLSHEDYASISQTANH